MTVKLTSTEVVRRFGDILAEVRHGGQTITITKNGESIAELRPVDSARQMTLRRFVAAWRDAKADESFAEDLERINQSDAPPTNPWG